MDRPLLSRQGNKDAIPLRHSLRHSRDRLTLLCLSISQPWYNHRYSEDELRPWIPKVKEVVEKTKITYGYFNNHFHGYAVENCLQVLEMLGLATPKQDEAKKRATQYINTGTIEDRPKGQTTLF